MTAEIREAFVAYGYDLAESNEGFPFNSDLLVDLDYEWISGYYEVPFPDDIEEEWQEAEDLIEYGYNLYLAEVFGQESRQIV